jgi:Glycosyltransferase family 92
MACQLPKTHWKLTPVAVSVVENMCDTATNNLKVIYNKLEAETKNPFAVCVKGLDFPDEDISVRMIEWLEVLASLGANKIFLYELEVHPNVTKVLKYYEKRGLVSIL